MLKKLTYIICLLSLGTAHAQVPDNEQILMETSSPASQWYYPALMMRYQAGDTTLTQTDYHYLYYGYAYDDRYHPLDAILAESRLLSLFGYGIEPTSEETMRAIVQCGEQVREADPFSPLNLNFLVYAYGALGDTVKERINYDRMTKVLAVISASGTGLKNNSPMHILRFEHARDWIVARGGEIATSRVVSRETEFVSLLAKDADGNRGYFFDFSRVYWRRPETLRQPERQWSINGITN